jgi:flagellar motor switch protein FliM
MADGEEQQSVLGLKAQAAQKAFEARDMSPSKALRRALARAADTLWDLALVCQGVNAEILDQDGVIAALRPGQLLLLLDGPDGAVGLCAVDRAVLTGVVEVQTIAQVTTLAVDEDRELTTTDAAMMAPLLDGAMQRFADNLDDHPLREQLEGFRFGAMVEDARAASLLLDAPGYRSFEVAIDLALGRRKGTLRVILPDRPRRRETARQEDAVAGPGPHEALLERLPARLDCLLTGLVLPLSRAQALKPGDLLPLPEPAAQSAVLCAAGGQRVAGGHMGQLDGRRAVRLAWPVGAYGQAEPDHLSGGSTPDPAPAKAAPPAPQVEPVEAEKTPDALPDLPPLDFEAAMAEEGGFPAMSSDLGEQG